MLFCACPCLWGLKGGRKIVEHCQIYEALLMNWIFSVFKVDLIRDRHSGRVLFSSILSAGRDRGRWQEYARVSCIMLFRSFSPYMLTQDQAVSLLNTSVQALLPIYYQSYFVLVRTAYFPLPDGHFFWLSSPVDGVLYRINMLTNGPL